MDLLDDLDEDDFIFAGMGLLLSVYIYLTATNNKRWWTRPLYEERNIEGAYVKIFRHMYTRDHEMFFKYTRMTPACFDKLLEMIHGKLLKRSRREFLVPRFRLALTLKYLAHGGSFQNLAWEFRVGHSTVGKVIYETCEAIWEILQPIYLTSPNDCNWLNISSGFFNKWNLPHTLGAIDGKHVQIQCPINSGSLYYNYKGHFSVVLLACCDADYKFIWVDIGAWGSEHDAGIFRRSKMGEDLDKGVINLPTERKLPGSETVMTYFFVGDEAFPLKSYIMRPYPGKYLGEQKLIFNYRLSRARRVIENAFGILASRWRVYRAPLLCSVKTTESIIKATVCLHNFLKTEISSKYSPKNLIDSEDDNGVNVSGEWREITRTDTNLRPVGRLGSNLATRAIYKLRDKLADYLISDAGSIPWQFNHVNRGKRKRQI